MDEFDLIERYFAGRGAGDDVVVGVGDDGAVLSVPKDRDLVVVVDTLVEDVHFPASLGAADLGYRAVAVNLSDIAAMGAEPRWMTLALTLRTAEPDWLEAFSAGLGDAAAAHGVALVGGDTTSGDQVVVSVQVGGYVEPGKALCRSGAAPGERVYVTGTVGDAAAGLERLESGRESVLVARFRRPSPRVACGRALVGIASAAIDVSDGLYADLGKLAAASGVGAEIDLARLPLSDALEADCDVDAQRRFALNGGDDYELCFTAASAPVEIAGVPVTEIGTITEATGVVCHEDGIAVPWQDPGYLHFG